MPRPKLHSYNEDNLAFARRLRKEMSVSEKWLWHRLRDQKTGFRFRRQVPIEQYVLDFYCPEVKLCVEVDGEQHELRKSRDAKRDAVLLQRGIHTLRIPSLDLFQTEGDHLTVWLNRILDYCESVAGRPAIRDFTFESDRKFEGPNGF